MSPASLCPGFQETRPAPSPVARSLLVAVPPGCLRPALPTRGPAPALPTRGPAAYVGPAPRCNLPGTSRGLKQRGEREYHQSRDGVVGASGGVTAKLFLSASAVQSLCYYSLLLKIS